MDADAAMDLIVQPHLTIGLIRASRKLDAIHAEIGVTPAGAVGVLGIDLRQRDEGAAVARPAHQLRQFVNGRFARQNRTVADGFRPQVPERPGHAAIAPRTPPEGRRIDLQLDEAAHGIEGIAEKVARPFEGAEQVAYHRKAAALDAGEENGGALRLVDAPLDLGGLQVGVDLDVEAHEPAGSLQVEDAFAQTAVTDAPVAS